MGIGALPTFLVIAGVGFLLYHLLPVVGPAPYFDRSFPFATDRAYLPAPRNAMPSLHTAWVLIAFLATRGMSLPTRMVTGVAIIGTIIAILGSGEHYLTDLVVACPFVLLVRALCAIELPLTARERAGSLLFGSALLLVAL
jgi:membrane-associated phospholipid phosphatase